jgi:cell division septation protein DedD
MTADDTEITLGAGKLLGLFFLLAAICGVFFSIGYSLGRTSGREQALNDQAANSTVAAPAAATGSDSKPSAGISVKAEGTPATGNGDTQTPMTFYKAVQQNSTDASQPTSEAKPATDAKTPKPGEQISGKMVAIPATTPIAKTTETPRPSPVTGPGTIVVQIAAVSREDDAVALAGALRRKNYNVFVVNNPITNDKLYHVQVGPFANIQDAQAMKEKLVAEGYNPIIKR